jgi:hypothetical protein
MKMFPDVKDDKALSQPDGEVDISLDFHYKDIEELL